MMHVRVKKSDSTVLNNVDVGRQVRSQLGRGSPKRQVVRVTGDPLGLPPELGDLLRDCGCSAFFATGMAASQNGTHLEPELTIVNFASNQAANPERVQALREKNPKPVVCLLEHPTEQEIAQVASIRTNLVIFKPLCAQEFKIRIRLLLWEQRAQSTDPTLSRGRRGADLKLSERDKSVVRCGEALRLTRKEYALLSLLASNPGQIFPIAEIVRAVWSGSQRATAADVHTCVYALRKKIETDPSSPRWIITVPSCGYRLELDGGTKKKIS
jgi:two-component system KDP operon response regulator KdpE